GSEERGGVGGGGGGGGGGGVEGRERGGDGRGTSGLGATRGTAAPAHLHQGMSYTIASSVALAKAGPIITASGILGSAVARARQRDPASSLCLLHLAHASIDFGGQAFENFAHLDRMGGAGLEPAQRLGQALEVARRPRPNRIERGR